ncbi:MAG: SpoIIE family protein phosphatase, partial [Phycisphaerales bacterium]|nr:SpoIIE family protein phosphatase [Phycisphaerales bacterium]
LAPVDTIFLITDRVTEAARGGEYAAGMFEESRVIALIKAHVGAPLEAIRDALNAELDQFTAGVYHDDVTFVIARRQGATA